MQALNRGPRPFYAKLHNQVIIAIVAAIVMGAAWPDTAMKMKPLGDGFIKLIGMVIAPLVFCIIVSGISGMASAGRVARIGVKTMVYFYVVSALALLLGLIAANLIPTGVGLNIDPRSIDTSSIAGYVTAAKDQGVVAFLLNVIPVTMIDAFAKGAVLQVVLIAVLFGVALIFLGDRARLVKDFVDQLTRVVFSIVEMIITLSPIGAFGAMAFTVGRFGLHSLLPLLKLIGVFYGACLVFVLIVLVPIARHIGFSILKFCRYILDEILIFLSIANSEALLPRLMEKLERMGVPKSVVGLVVPTGYSFNLAVPVNKIIEKNNSNNISIMIVEDEEINCLFMEVILKNIMKLNCKIIYAKNGKEAVDFCKEDTKIDVILMDIKMPVFSPGNRRQWNRDSAAPFSLTPHTW